MDTRFSELAASLRSQNGHTLNELSAEHPVLVTFLRHAGCPFCREALADLAKIRQQLANEQVQLAFVHMGAEDKVAQRFFGGFGLEDVERFSDPDCQLYRALGLARGSLLQVIGPSVWWRGFVTSMVGRNGFGKPIGDIFQMAGAFVIDHGQVVSSFHHRTSADRPDYLGMCKVG